MIRTVAFFIALVLSAWPAIAQPILTKVVDVYPPEEACRSWSPEREMCMATSVDVLINNTSPFTLVVTMSCTAFDSAGNILGQGRSDTAVRREYLAMQPFGTDTQAVQIAGLDFVTIHRVDCRATTERLVTR